MIDWPTARLGLEFVRQYAACEADIRLYACCRNPAAADPLNAIAASSSGSITVHQLDAGLVTARSHHMHHQVM
jgi:hypothetical protein